MARPREFDRNEALDKALEVFWVQGYEATSMSDIQRALGIGRQSLYNTFGDKPSIFAEAFDRYVAGTEQMFAQRFGPDAGIEEIRAHLHDAARGLVAGERRGCMIMNTSMERGPHDPCAASYVERGLGAMRAAFRQALAHSQSKGEIPADVDITDAAESFVAQNAGLAVLARSGTSSDALIRLVDVSIDALRT